MECSPPGSSVYGILQQEYWSGSPCPPPGVLPHPGIDPASLILRVDSLPLSRRGSPKAVVTVGKCLAPGLQADVCVTTRTFVYGTGISMLVRDLCLPQGNLEDRICVVFFFPMCLAESGHAVFS